MAEYEKLVYLEEGELFREAQRFRLDWKKMLNQRWDSSFAIRAGYARFGFLTDIVLDLWRVLAEYYGVGISAVEQFETAKVCEHICAVISEEVPELSQNLDGRAVKDILWNRYRAAVSEGQPVKKIWSL